MRYQATLRPDHPIVVAHALSHGPVANLQHTKARAAEPNHPPQRAATLGVRLGNARNMRDAAHGTVSRTAGASRLDPHELVAATLTHTSTPLPTGALTLRPVTVPAGAKLPPDPGCTNTV